jgi:hypothetical protein
MRDLATITQELDGAIERVRSGGDDDSHTIAQEAEALIQAAVDQAPEPLRRLGRFLSDVLDEDHWKTAEAMLLAIAAYGPEGKPRNRAISPVKGSEP